MSMRSASRCTYNTLQPYEPPSWARHLKCQPNAYVQLAMRPTPIHRWDLPGVPSGFEVFVKRDDLTGCALSGNKCRKLEFLLADALQQGCDSVITAGFTSSNHARATAVAARQVGLQPHLVLYTRNDPSDIDGVGCEGNLLLDRLAASKIILKTYEGQHLEVPNLKAYAEKLKAEGSKAYIIPLGGSNTVGTWGYMDGFQEMIDQGVLEDYDDIIVVAGSGGTVCGIAIANYLTGCKVKVHAVCMSNNVQYICNHIDEALKDLGITEDKEEESPKARDIVDIIEGYWPIPFTLKPTEEDLAQVIDIFTKTGVSVEHLHTLKGVRGLLGEMQKNQDRFAGKRILYIHTGGLFELYDGAVNQTLKTTPVTNQVYNYTDVMSK